MQLGVITGKTTTRSFAFDAESRVRKTDYVCVKDPEGVLSLASVDRITADGSGTRAEARVIGFRDSRGFLRTPKVPFAPGTPVFPAETKFIRETIGLRDSGAYIGLLDGYDLKVHLPPEQLIKKHVSVLAKTGSGKSYLTGVILEELAENRVPVVVIDPHGEYFTLQAANSKEPERKLMERFGVQPKSYKGQVQVFGFRKEKCIKLSSRLGAEEIIHILPEKPQASQRAILFSAVRGLEGRDYSLTDVMDEVSKAKQDARFSLLSSLESLMRTAMFSTKPTSPEELVQDGRISVVDLKAARPEIQEMVVMKLAEDLFLARKRGKIPPFLFVLEEAHNFCPERGFGEAASSRILRTIASEGRKFGMGLMMVSQRPARVDKSVLSQCNTQVILKVTNPNDLRAISQSVEGMAEGVKEEIRDLPVGVAMVVGITDQPLIVDVRIRRSEHGGESVQADGSYEEDSAPKKSFQPRVPKEEVLLRYKGTDSATMLKYPLWRIAIEGVSGRLRSQNQGKKAIYFDGMTGRMVFERGDSLERTLLGKRPGSGLFPIKKEPSDIFVPGFAVEPAFSRDSVKRALSNMKIREAETELVYYPYWLVRKKGKKTLVDAVSNRMDPEAMEAVRERV